METKEEVKKGGFWVGAEGILALILGRGIQALWFPDTSLMVIMAITFGVLFGLGHILQNTYKRPTVKTTEYTGSEDRSEKLNAKWWYRLLKCFYVFIYTVSVVIVCGYIISEWPVRDFSLDKYVVVCNDGRQYSEVLNTALNDDLTYRDPATDSYTRIACAYADADIAKIGSDAKKEAPTENMSWEPYALGLIILKEDSESSKPLNPPIQKNYHVEVTPYYSSDKGEVILFGIISLVSIVIIMWLIQNIFLYVVTGRKFKFPKLP